MSDAHDPCSELHVVTDPSVTAAQADGVTRAVAMWRDHGAAGLVDGAGDAEAAEIVLRTQQAAPFFRGLYDDRAGIIYVNSLILDPETIGIVIAHELGHAFGLQHVPPEVRASVMNPGNTTVPPTDADRAMLESMWGICGGGS
jgi:hypothetical protein